EIRIPQLGGGVYRGNVPADLSAPSEGRLQSPQIELAAQLEQPRNAAGIDHYVIVHHHHRLVTLERFAPMLVAVMQVLELGALALEMEVGELTQPPGMLPVVHHPQVEIPPPLQPGTEIAPVSGGGENEVARTSRRRIRYQSHG